MKFYRFILSVAFIAVVATASVLAQTRPAATQPKPTTAPASSASGDSAASVPSAKIAVIYSQAFLDQKTGIARFTTLVTTLNREFQSKDTELQQLAQKISALNDELTKAGAASGVSDAMRAKADQLEQMKKDYQRKGEDGQAAYNKRRGELFQPLNDDIGKALEVYAKAHNINVIIDGSQVPVVYAADAIDITEAFIKEFNAKNPATAAVTTPK
jgi:Skp family chaperone for outer membrane proteins